MQLVLHFHVCQVSTNFYMFELWILEYDVVFGIWQGLLIALSKELQGRFPIHGVANNLSVVYPQY